VYRLTEDMIMEFLPPGVEGGVSYCCRYERPGVDSRTAHILKNSTSLSKFLDFLSGLEEFVQKKSWGHLATSKLPSHYVGLIIFISAIVHLPPLNSAGKMHGRIMILKISRNLPSWRSVSKENSQGSQIIIIQIRKLERVLKTFVEELEELADILLNKDS
jgi:hypothetical protein